MLRNIISLQKRSCVFRKEQGMPASTDTILMDAQDYRLLTMHKITGFCRGVVEVFTLLER